MTKTAISANGEAMPVSRRHLLGAALAGTAISVAALTTPVAAAVTKSEPADPDQAIAHHAQKLAEALCRKNGGLWRYHLTSRQGINAFLFLRAADGPTGTLSIFE